VPNYNNDRSDDIQLLIEQIESLRLRIQEHHDARRTSDGSLNTSSYTGMYLSSTTDAANSIQYTTSYDRLYALPSYDRNNIYDRDRIGISDLDDLI